MCLIIKNLDGKPIPFSVIRAAVKQNRDGYGRLDLPSGKVRRTLDMQEALRMAMEPGKAVHHFRLGTAGGKTIENVHPFEITPNWLLFHNGQVPSFNGKTKSDSANLARFLGSMHKKDWKEAFELFDSSRFLAIHRRTGEHIKIGDQWTEKDGIWYSNNYHFRSDTMVAMYDNFAEGGVMNKEILFKKDFIDKGETEDKHRLCFAGGMPFLLEGDGSSSGESRGEHLEMDIYEVNASTLEKLDIIHHHPGFYERRLTQLETLKEGPVWAWVYYCTDERMDNGKYFYWDNKKDDKKDTPTITTDAPTTTTTTSMAVVDDDEDDAAGTELLTDKWGGRWGKHGYEGPSGPIKPKSAWDKDAFMERLEVLDADDEDDPPFETYTLDEYQVFSDRQIKELAEIGLYLIPGDHSPELNRFCDDKGNTYDDDTVKQFTNDGAAYENDKPKYLD